MLESDPFLPSVCSLITGQPLRGSWWSHPQAQTIFQVNELLDDHEDVLLTKLVSGKVTFVHRKLWADLFAIGSARAQWQLSGLSVAARNLLGAVDANDIIRTDQLSWPDSSKTKPGDAARELEKKLLVVASQVHTEFGAHAKSLETWEYWLRRSRSEASSVTSDAAMKNLEKRLTKMNQQFGGKATLPWGAKTR